MRAKTWGANEVCDFNWRNYVIYISFLVIFLFFSIAVYNKSFLTGGNLMNIARQTAMVSVMAIGMTFVLSAGEIDLSIGSIVALSSLITALTLRDTNNLVLAVVAGLGSGALIGLINGLLATKVNIPSFLVTLGTSGIISGFARWITNLEAVPVTNDTYNFVFGSGDLGPVSILFVWTGLLLIAGHVLLRNTAFGRKVLATGGNRIAARYSGVRVDRIKIMVLVMKWHYGGPRGYAIRWAATRCSLYPR